MVDHSSNLGFPCGSDGKESACNAGDLGSIPGFRRSPGGGRGYPLQYSCHGQREPGGLQTMRSQESDRTERLSRAHTQLLHQKTENLGSQSLKNPHGQRNLADFIPWGRSSVQSLGRVRLFGLAESDTTARPSTLHWLSKLMRFSQPTQRA